MQGKGLVKGFAILLLAICLYQLSFTFMSNRVENKAKAYAKGIVSSDLNEKDSNQEIKRLSKAYLDSLQNKPAVNLGVTSYTYQELKSKALKLGLDLQGGMSVVLQVAIDKAIESMAGGVPHPQLMLALENARLQETATQEDFVSLFGSEFKKIDPSVSLASVFANSPDYSSQIDFSSTDAEVLELIKTETASAIETTFEIIRTRIDKFGVTQPNISLQKNSGRILVELPGVDDVDRVRSLLQAEANLEFWEVFTMSNEIATAVDNANKAVKNKRGIVDTPKAAKTANDGTASTDTSNTDGLLNDGELLTESEDSLEQSAEEFNRNNPFYKVFKPYSQIGTAAIGYVESKDIPEFKVLMEDPEVKAAFPRNLKLILGKDQIESQPTDGSDPFFFRQVFALKSRFGDTFTPPLDGGVITNASSNLEQNGQVKVNMSMNAEGARKWKNLTRENINKPVAVVLDNLVYSAPNVLSEISGGSSQITGNFSIEEGQDLANILKIGKLPAPARIVEEAVTGPTLGAESIRSGILSLLFGLLIVLGFMIFYYNKGGIVSVLALLLNLFFVIGVLASIGTTLTLPGIAGIVLTIGMAVDANVIIYERIREELANGSSMRKSIAEGFRRSYSAIIDANLTTLITAGILAYFGLGPVLGFAVILIIGIFSSLFTAVLLSKLLIDWWQDKGTDMSFSRGLEFFKDANYDFVTKRRWNYLASLIFISLGVIAIFARGFELGVDFNGGRTYQVEFDQPVSTVDLANTLSASFGGQEPTVTTYDSDIRITTSYLIDSRDKEVDNSMIVALHEGVKGFYANPPSLQDFSKNNLRSSQKVGPTIADDIRTGAFKATIFALIGIFLYILFRFRKWQFGLAAVITVIHDSLILLSIFAIFHGILPFGMEINQAFIAALLTVIGYSINDTVVVFDRIREYLLERRGKNSLGLINDAINSTLSRTIITSVTTLFVILVLFIFGSGAIKGFAFALLIGVIVGTYSSIFIATPLVIDLSKEDVKLTDGAGQSERKRQSALS